MVAGHMYYPSERKHYTAVGYASWYGDAFHGRRTANGEIFDRNSISAAHPTMPLPSYARVTNLRNHYSMIVRVNDRGPFAPGRIMDVSRRVADLLDFRRTGTTKVKVEYLGRASLEGSDDEKLASTLTDRRPFGAGRAARACWLTPTADSKRPRPTRARCRNRATDPARAPTARKDTADAGVPPSQVFIGTAPLPPSRPFDLDTVPGADAEIGETASR